MKKKDIIRAWRDGEFYASLTDEQKEAMPQSPAELLQIDDEALAGVAGGCGSGWTSAVCTPCPPKHCY